MTNLKGPMQQETLLQVPPSQKETAGVCQRPFPCMSSCRSNRTEEKEEQKKLRNVRSLCDAAGINMMVGVCTKIWNYVCLVGSEVIRKKNSEWEL